MTERQLQKEGGVKPKTINMKDKGGERERKQAYKWGEPREVKQTDALTKLMAKMKVGEEGGVMEETNN
ncbi:uncharacterized protein G2W53_034124 [Senna tora]|uniref:Uncharacterized protein n=1 Tax=Senna tora TaxID=362788 RepID=A0A834T0V0_9FABA|nr:uncharacterized protein G2W53_034124 [Senna tora]